MTSPWSLAIPAPPQSYNHILGAWQLTYIYDDSRSHDCNLPLSLPKSKLVGEAGKVSPTYPLHIAPLRLCYISLDTHTLLSLVEFVLHLPSHSHTLEHSPQVFCYTLAMITWQLTHLSYSAAAISNPVIFFLSHLYPPRALRNLCYISMAVHTTNLPLKADSYLPVACLQPT